MQLLKRKIRVGPEIEISSVWAIPDESPAAEPSVLILAHGAGNNMDNPFLSFVHEGLAKAGILAVKFNFPYMELGRKAPDRPPILENAWKAAIAAVRTDPSTSTRRLFLGGKSMGGRVASLLASKGEPCAGLVFLGYPLHPAGRVQQLRVEHWPDIAAPMLFIEGTRDPLCRLDLLKAEFSHTAAAVTLHEIQGGDHSFKIPAAMKRNPHDIWQEIVDVTTAWVNRIPA